MAPVKKKTELSTSEQKLLRFINIRLQAQSELRKINFAHVEDRIL